MSPTPIGSLKPIITIGTSLVRSCTDFAAAIVATVDGNGGRPAGPAAIGDPGPELAEAVELAIRVARAARVEADDQPVGGPYEHMEPVWEEREVADLGSGRRSGLEELDCRRDGFDAPRAPDLGSQTRHRCV